ncbi:hypothetical protein LEL_04117 [Akanthomyces lecanii RCEF 1005]|uniref:Protein kinase-like domain protein n=1 Tax=Akanthomyces lecanii RCEF 1005 TaxID=1081108 RepID=A0A168H4G5_CORDF|nr:hypothetical protein LEL_04117 [Akanthomyces lecanii RCEF 1005]
MSLAHEQNLDAAAIAKAVLSIPLAGGDGDGGRNATYEGQCGENDYLVFRNAAATILAHVDAERRKYEALAAAAASGRCRWSARLLGASLTFDNPHPLSVPAARLGRREAAGGHADGADPVHAGDEAGRPRPARLAPIVLGDDADSRHFAVEHADLAADSSILRSSSSDKHTIEAIIDWGPAEMVPLCQAARFPFPAALLGRTTTTTTTTCRARRLSRIARWSDVDSRTLYWEFVKSESMLPTAMMRSDVGWTLPFSRHRHGEEEGWRETACAEVGEVESASFDLCSIYSDTVTDHNDAE